MFKMTTICLYTNLVTSIVMLFIFFYHKNQSEWVSSFLTAHQHIIDYSVPYNGLENAIKDEKYNQGYLATIKYE